MTEDAATSGNADRLPVFALNAVLFPAGVLSLRVFEARYVDMIRACLRNDSPFVVCRITQGAEVGLAAEHETIGCIARIAEWDMEQAGLMLVRAAGGQRVRVSQRQIERDGLVRALVEPIAPEPDLPLPDQYAGCRELLRKMTEDIDEQAGSSLHRPIARPYDFDSSSWVGNRLCELLPLPIAARQKLMELDNPLMRLSLVLQFLTQRGVL
jgi:Lon protease-like protein